MKMCQKVSLNFVLFLNLVADIEGGTQAEGVRE